MFNIHWQPYHYDGTEPPYFAEMGVKFVKIVWMGNAPPYIEHIPPEAKLIYRDFGFEEQNRHLLSSDPLECAAVHVQRCVDTCANLLQRGLSKDRQLYESINEPQIWAGETKANVCTYCEAFLEGLHAHGLHGVIGNLSVGWPDNSGPETPPVWDWFYPALDAMEPGDYLGAHEYWSDGGCGEMWGWWGGRILKIQYHIPILITECGVDSGVKYGSGHHGWQTHYDLPLDEAAIRYTDELWDYMGRLAQDCRIQGITPFTYDCAGGPNPEWWSFDQRPDALKNAHRAKKASEGIPQPGIFEWGDPPPPPLPPPPPPPAHAVEHLEGVLPWNVNGKRWKQRDPLDIVRVAVHHTSVDPKRDDYDYSVTHINAINRYHIQHNGWPRIGYHYCIDRVGRIFQVNSLRDISYHVGGYNARSIGVALFGALHQHDPTDEQVDALHWLRDFLDLPGIGHYELVPTKCPGPWWLVWKDCINQPYEPGPEPEPEPEPGAPYTMTITFQPGGSIFLIAGNYPLAWIPIELENEWGYLWRTTSGTKPEHGPGGFEFNVPNAGKYRFSAEGHAWDQFSIHEHGMISLAFS